MRSAIPRFQRCLSSQTLLASSSVVGLTCLGGWLLHDEKQQQVVSFRPNGTIAQCEGGIRQKLQPYDKSDHVKMIFLGTGSSTGCPRPLCPMVFKFSSTKPTNMTVEQEQLWDHCQVSNLAILGNPKTNKNYRNNPCFLIQSWDGSRMRNVVIDVGKTFRETTLRWFPEYDIQSLDAIVVTHHHMDAAGGADDLRNFQSIDRKVYKETGRIQRQPTPVYLSHFCWTNLREQFPWLFPSAERVRIQQDSSQPVVRRDVASLDVQIFQDYEGFEVVPGLTIIPLPVLHGDDLVSHGFAFSVHNRNGKPTHVVYLSDISKMIPETLEFIRKKLPPTDILIVDALLFKGTNPVHFNLDQAMAVREQIQPRDQTYLVGMSCDAFPPHDKTNAYLKKNYGSVQLAHDGLVIDTDEMN